MRIHVTDAHFCIFYYWSVRSIILSLKGDIFLLLNTWFPLINELNNIRSDEYYVLDKIPNIKIL